MLFGWRQGWIRAQAVGVSAMMTASLTGGQK